MQAPKLFKRILGTAAWMVIAAGLPAATATPARISFDLPNVTRALPSRRIDVHSSGLDTILAAETKDRTRVVLNLDKLMPYDAHVSGNSVIVMLGSGSAGAATAAA